MKEELLEELKEAKLVSILRLDSGDDIIDVIEALVRGGVRFVEITLTMPDAPALIKTCSEHFGGRAVIGAGTVMDANDAETVIAAGAKFVVSPITEPEVIRCCNEKGVAVMPGAVTPTEIYRAWKLGADVIKVFSARLGGPQYFRDVKGPLPQIEIMPTGGVDIETAPAFLKAGACAVGIGGALLPKQLIAEKRFDELSEHVSEIYKAVTAQEMNCE